MRGKRREAIRKGARFEALVARTLEDLGLYVIRSYKSRGPADLVAVGFKADPLMFIQCKAHLIFSIDEWNDFFDVAKRRGAIPVLARLHEDEVEMFRLKGPRLQPGVWPWEKVTIEAEA